MHHDKWPATWAPYMTWAKHHVPARYDLTGSNLLHCTLDDLRGARNEMELFARNDEGYPPLLEAIAHRYGVGTERVALATGAAGATFLALGALIRPGDVVLAEWPGYDPHAGAARFLGADVRTFSRSASDGFRLDADVLARELLTRPRAVLVTNLHNPSGVYTDPWALMSVAEVAAAVGTKVIVDEVYLETAIGEDNTPAATKSEALISVNSLTKAFGLAGLRIGWALADPDTVERMRRVRDVVDGVGAVPSERLGVLAFDQIDRLLDRARRILEPNAHLLKRFVETRDELDWVAPAEGASIGFPRIVGVDDSGPFLKMAHEEFGVGLVPGRHFGAPAHFRVSVAGEKRTLEDGLEALGRALDTGWS